MIQKISFVQLPQCVFFFLLLLKILVQILHCPGLVDVFHHYCELHLPYNVFKTKLLFRLYDLARPKTYDRLLIKSNSSWEWGAWKSDVPKEALSHSASARLETLAESKKLHSLYQDNRPVQWFVSDAARNTQVNVLIKLRICAVLLKFNFLHDCS